MSVYRKLAGAVLVLALGAVLSVLVYKQILVADGMELAENAESISPLQAGDRAPAFTVQTVDSESYDFAPDDLQRPTILISIRGGWCPYCNVQLSELRHVIPELNENGFDVLFLSSDRPEILLGGLKEETQESIDGLDYVILSDAEGEAARAFGTAFRVSDEQIQKMNDRGYNYQDSSIDKYRVLGVPSVFVIDVSGDIAFAYSNPDYKVRLAPDALMEAAAALNAK